MMSRRAAIEVVTSEASVSHFTAGLVYSGEEAIWAATRLKASSSGSRSQTRFSRLSASGCGELPGFSP